MSGMAGRVEWQDSEGRRRQVGLLLRRSCTPAKESWNGNTHVYGKLAARSFNRVQHVYPMALCMVAMVWL